MSSTPTGTQFPYLPGPFAFRPPLPNAQIIWLMRKFAVFYLRSVGIREVDVPAESLEILRPLKGKRVVLVSNHPGYEPVLMFQLSSMLGMDFRFLAAKEVFTKSWLQGFVAQRLGAYSIVRGTSDRMAFKTTRDILVAGNNWLVAFPGGQDHYMTDMVIPFQDGVVQLAFWALDTLSKGGSLPPLYIVPCAVRYHYKADMSKAIAESLTRLEQALNLTGGKARVPQYQRLMGVASQLLSNNENYNRIPAGEGMSVKDRLDRLRNVMLSRVADSIGVSAPDKSIPLRDQLRVLFNALDEVRSTNFEKMSKYERDLQARSEHKAAELYEELDRVLGFVGVSGTYIEERPTVERFLDVLSRLEREVLRKDKRFAPQRAVLMVGEPVDISGQYAQYKQARRATVRELTLSLESAVRGLLEQTTHLMTPLEDSAEGKG